MRVPDHAGKRQCINLALLRKPFSYTVEQRINPHTNGEDANFGTWEQALHFDRSYLVGSLVPMGEFLRVHTSSLNEWQRMAYDWCLANPSRLLVLTATTSHLIYPICICLSEEIPIRIRKHPGELTHELIDLRLRFP